MKGAVVDISQTIVCPVKQITTLYPPYTMYICSSTMKSRVNTRNIAMIFLFSYREFPPETSSPATRGRFFPFSSLSISTSHLLFPSFIHRTNSLTYSYIHTYIHSTLSHYIFANTAYPDLLPIWRLDRSRATRPGSLQLHTLASFNASCCFFWALVPPA